MPYEIYERRGSEGRHKDVAVCNTDGTRLVWNDGPRATEVARLWTESSEDPMVIYIVKPAM